MAKFWKFAGNKFNLLHLSRARAFSESDDIVVSGVEHEQDFMVAKRKVNGEVNDKEELQSWEEEAVQKFILHIKWAVAPSAEKVVVLCK